MDIMVVSLQIIVLSVASSAVRLAVSVSATGGAGVLILGLRLGMKPGNIPWDVILIIASVISAISAMQLGRRLGLPRLHR